MVYFSIENNNLQLLKTAKYAGYNDYRTLEPNRLKSNESFIKFYSSF